MGKVWSAFWTPESPCHQSLAFSQDLAFVRTVFRSWATCRMSLIIRQSDFDSFCREIRAAGIVAFDSEFVSEFTYRPELCLLQLATPTRRVAVDPFEVTKLDQFWDIMLDPAITVVVHGGREEVRFCLANTDQPPVNLIDIQIAEGLRSPSFPLSYTALVGRVLGVRTEGKETRTDWRRRPLSAAQIHYALEDVEHVLDVWNRQSNQLRGRGRIDWAQAEFQRFVDEIAAERTREGWRRLSGLNRLTARELAVVRELYEWREQESITRNRPVRKTLRDDLLVDLAKRQPSTVDELLATRDLNRSEYRRAADDILDAISRGARQPASKWPALEKVDRGDEEQVVGQLLGIALANLCLQEDVAMQLVGTSSDLRQLVRWHLHGRREDPPRLMQGWRATVCGTLLTDLLDGKIRLRVADPKSDHPLVFERHDSL